MIINISPYFHLIIATMIVIEEIILSSIKIEINKRNIYRVILFSITVSLYGAIRNPLGMIDNYAGEFYIYSKQTFLEVFRNNLEYEPLYRLFVKLVQYIFDDVQMLFAIQSIIVTFSFGFFTFRHSNNICISFLIFFMFRSYSLYMCAMRQGLAMAIFLLFSDKYLINKKYAKFIISVLVASMFHKSILVMLLLPIINKKRDTELFIPILYGSSLILRVSGALLLKVVQLLPVVSDYDNYIKISFNQGGKQTTLYVYIVLVLFYYYIVKSSDKSIQKNQQCLAIGTAIQIIGDAYGAFSRVAFYFFPYASLLFPDALKYFVPKKTAFYLFLLLLFIQFALFGPGQVGNNYSFFWN